MSTTYSFLRAMPSLQSSSRPAAYKPLYSTTSQMHRHDRFQAPLPTRKPPAVPASVARKHETSIANSGYMRPRSKTGFGRSGPVRADHTATYSSSGSSTSYNPERYGTYTKASVRSVSPSTFPSKTNRYADTSYEVTGGTSRPLKRTSSINNITNSLRDVSVSPGHGQSSLSNSRRFGSTADISTQRHDSYLSQHDRNNFDRHVSPAHRPSEKNFSSYTSTYNDSYRSSSPRNYIGAHVSSSQTPRTTLNENRYERETMHDLYDNNAQTSVSNDYYSTKSSSIYDYSKSEEHTPASNTPTLPHIHARKTSPKQTGSTERRESVTGRATPNSAGGRRGSDIGTTSRRSSLVNSMNKENEFASLDSNIFASRGQIGLRNIGNTCFANCIIQCLAHCKPLLEFTLKGLYKSQINTTISKSKGEFFQVFADQMQSMWSGSSPSISEPKRLINKLHQYSKRFGDGRQHDAQEVLMAMLDLLHEDINRKQKRKPKTYPRDDEEDHLSDSAKARKAWERYTLNDDSKIIDLFVGQLKSSLRCQSCGYCSVTVDPYFDLSLPLPNKVKRYGSSDVTLDDCLNLFTKEEVLDGDERPYCAKCKERRTMVKSLMIYKFPKILMLHLKRFGHYGGGFGRTPKLDTEVSFPIENLDLSAYAVEENKSPAPRYSLFGVANHSGFLSSGHYTAYCKHPYSGKWLSCNDSRVSETNARRIVSSQAYVLFYELVDNTTSRL